MKRLNSSDSLIPICLPGPSDDKGIYSSRGFTTMLGGLDEDDLGGDEELCSSGVKKRRLSSEQVRALEKNFEVENKLDPERKVRLARDLGLQPRQVAVWFQNRRARWKTKQLERDYSALKASYDALRADFNALHHDKQSLIAEIKALKAKLAEEERESLSSVKEDEDEDGQEIKAAASTEEEQPALIYKDVGSSDSDSSAVINDDCSGGYAAGSSSNTSAMFLSAVADGSNGSSNLSGHEKGELLGLGLGFSFHQMLLKGEDNEFLSGDDSPCGGFFSDEQPPSLSWYCADQYCWMDMGRREGAF